MGIKVTKYLYEHNTGILLDTIPTPHMNGHQLVAQGLLIRPQQGAK